MNCKIEKRVVWEGKRCGKRIGYGNEGDEKGRKRKRKDRKGT